MKRCWLLPAFGVLGLACADQTTSPITELNLNRPVDVAFACYGNMRQTNGDVVPSAQPTVACQTLSPPLTGTGVPFPGQEPIQGQPPETQPAPAWYAFILQSTAGTVAVARWAAEPAEDLKGGLSDGGGDFHVIDADPLTPGKNAISIGEEPVAIATDHSGCYEVTANAGSCDLSALNIDSALDDVAENDIARGTAKTPVSITRIPVTNAAGVRLLARPAAMVGEPGAIAANEPGVPVVGNVCTAKPSGSIYVAYPSCHLVAGIDTATGKIVSAIRFDASTGVPSLLTGAALDNVSCPDECPSDITRPLGNGPITPGVRPVALDVRKDTRVDASKPAVTSRLVIGADNSHSLTIVELDPASFAPTAVSQVALEDPTGKLGITAVALSPQIGMGGNAAVAEPVGEAGPQAQFVYAVASDGTVRVADVLPGSAGPPATPRECDTQLDGRFLRTSIPAVSVTDLSCLPIGNAAWPRRSGARGPGIELPGHTVPTSVAIVHGRNTRPTTTANNVSTPVPASPSVWLGYFAIITSSSGAVYVVNVDDDYAPDMFTIASPLATAPVLVMPHQLRDNFTQRDAPSATTNGDHQCQLTDPPTGAHTGGPRLASAPAPTVPSNTLGTERTGELPTIQQVLCTQTTSTTDSGGNTTVTSTQNFAVSELEFGAPVAVRDVVYPDLRTVGSETSDLRMVGSETWRLTYEGTLSLDNINSSVDGPQVRSAQIVVDSNGMRLVEPVARPFCDMGVEPFDIVDLRGCNPANEDSDCPAEYTCYVHPASKVPVGACMLKTEAPRLADACFDFLSTLRRYTVGRTPDSNELVLFERKHELSTTPIDGCTSDDQCNSLAALAANINASADRFDPATTRWACQTDPLRAPINSDPARNKRCVQTCSTDPAQGPKCSEGTVCRAVAGGTDGVCLEGIEPPQACVNGPQRYDVRASEAFTVIGAASGYIHPITTDKNGACVRDPKASPVQIGRIPLKAPACTAGADPFTGATGGGFEANPCSLSVTQVASEPNYQAASCNPDPGQPTKLVTRDNVPAIKFRNRAMTLTLVDPTYPGDQTCVLDRAGNLGNIPFVVPGYHIDFAQTAGFTPYTLPLTQQTFTVRVVRGPTDSIWVVDDGDFLATTISQVSSRGRVYRVESVDPNAINIIQ